MINLLNVWWSIKKGSTRKRAVLLTLIGFALFTMFAAFNFFYIGLLFIIEAFSSANSHLSAFNLVNLADAKYFLVVSGILIIIAVLSISRAVLLMTFTAVFTLTNPVPVLRFGAYLEA